MEQNQNFDSQLQTYFNEIKHKIKKEHVKYLGTHPELRQILNDFLSSVLLEQPENVYEYAQKYFTFFNHKKDQVKHNPLVISGCSGVGKGTIIKNIINNHPHLFELSISFTTRNPRQGEVNGREYYFVTVETFKEEIKKDSFLEYCEVHGNYYGTHKGKLSDIISRGKIAILQIDVQGGKKIYSNKHEIPCNFLFIDVPSLEQLQKRLRGRGTEKQEDIVKRLKNGNQEIQESRVLEYYHKIINEDLEETFASVTTHFKVLYPNSLE